MPQLVRTQRQRDAGALAHCGELGAQVRQVPPGACAGERRVRGRRAATPCWPASSRRRGPAGRARASIVGWAPDRAVARGGLQGADEHGAVVLDADGAVDLGPAEFEVNRIPAQAAGLAWAQGGGEHHLDEVADAFRGQRVPQDGRLPDRQRAMVDLLGGSRGERSKPRRVAGDRPSLDSDVERLGERRTNLFSVRRERGVPRLVPTVPVAMRSMAFSTRSTSRRRSRTVPRSARSSPTVHWYRSAVRGAVVRPANPRVVHVVSSSSTVVDPSTTATPARRQR